ncbi:hypothetical protein EDB84DRAFT_1561274 [Lactarius hengduanensis]|nr:hypothetical protein EDB84DRAFT_1561274 [Lactarius hengduanensis]
MSPPSSHPRRPPLHHAPPRSRADGGAHKGEFPSSSSPTSALTAAPFSPSPPAPLVPPVRRRLLRTEGVRTRAPPPSLSPPGPFLPIRTKGRPTRVGMRTRAPATAFSLPAPTLPIRAEGGCTRARHPRHLPSPLAAPPRTRGKGHEGHPVATGPSPSPFDRAALYARERGTRGYATPGPTLPIRVEGGHRGTPPSAPPFDHATPVRAGKGHARARDTRPYPSHSCGRGAHEGHDTPFPLAAPLRTRGQGAREGKPPHPVALHSRGRGARGHPPPYVSRSRTGTIRVPAFTAPAPRFRAIVRLRQKIDVD